MQQRSCSAGSSRRAPASAAVARAERRGSAATPKRASHGTSAGRGRSRNGLSRRASQPRPSRIGGRAGERLGVARADQARRCRTSSRSRAACARAGHPRAPAGELVRDGRADRAPTDHDHIGDSVALDITESLYTVKPMVDISDFRPCRRGASAGDSTDFAARTRWRSRSPPRPVPALAPGADRISAQVSGRAAGSTRSTRRAARSRSQPYMPYTAIRATRSSASTATSSTPSPTSSA